MAHFPAMDKVPYISASRRGITVKVIHITKPIVRSTLSKSHQIMYKTDDLTANFLCLEHKPRWTVPQGVHSHSTYNTVPLALLYPPSQE